MLYPILIAEDDRKIANVVRAYLEEAGYRAVIAETGRDALRRAAEKPPLLVILDLALPDIGGEEVCQELKEMGDIPIIMLTSKASEDERLVGFALGADDYVTKPFSPRELVSRVKAVLKRTRREELGGAQLLSFNSGELVLDGASYGVTVERGPVTLTPTEFKLLLTLAASPQKVFSRDELVEKALGYQFEGYDRSIDAHVKNIRQKLRDDPRSPRFIQTVYGAGYRFAGKKDA
jgi:two-component system OmpR family response regulator